MSQKRQLAAIMFTDIEGYTSFMQEDEALALRIRAAHREIFKSVTEQFHGKILQYYGDGTLSIFDSALDATQCGIQLQIAFRNCENFIQGKKGVPVRIGIHLGDIILSEDDIIGDSVNVAARIESFATVGSVLISEKVYDEIKNQEEIQVKAMGQFDLKNVTAPVSIYAIDNQELEVPNPDQLQGKGERHVVKSNFIKNIWDKGHIQFIAAYFISVWGIIQFLEWVLNRYQLSPHWVDISLVFFISILPSVFLFIWNRERIQTGSLSRMEQYFFPGNLLLSIVLLFSIFRGVDLGATLQNVTYSNENGIVESRMIPKSGFKKSLAIHNFLPEQKDSLNYWLRRGIHAAIADDIGQNEFIKIGFWNQTSSLQEMISSSRGAFEFCLTGTFEIQGDNYTIHTKLYKTQNGKLKSSHSFNGNNFFNLIDSITLVIQQDIGLNQKQNEQFVNLPFSEAFTSNVDAYRHLSQFILNRKLSDLDQAIILDSTFAMAHYVKAEFLHFWSFSVLGAQEAIDDAMRHRKRLPNGWRYAVKRLYFQIYNQPEKVISLLKMKLELDPDNQGLIHDLTSYLYLISDYEELLKWRRTLVQNNPSVNNQGKLGEALMLNHQFDEAGELFQNLLDNHPQELMAMTSMTMYKALMGKTKEANELLEKVIIQDPEINPLIKEFQSAIAFADNHPQTSESLDKFIGQYRMQNRVVVFDISKVKNLLHGKGRTYTGGFFFIPSAKDEFLMGSEYYLEKWKFISDDTDQIYKINVFRLDRNKQTFTNSMWRQDSFILKANALFAMGENEAALEAFKLAAVQNPHHFYLKQFIQHLEFIVDPENSTAIENLKSYAGRYGPRHIWLENDKFYYTRDGEVAKQQLLPISANKFYFYGGYEYQMEVVLENNKPKGTVSWQYNPKTNQFERDDSDYIDFDKLQD